eukprot:gene4154-4563_t
MSDWFTSLASSALKVVDDIADSLVSQANEAQALLQEEQRKLQREENNKQEIIKTHQLLPWETSIEARQILCKGLMEHILSLSLHEENFLHQAANASEVIFSLQDFAPTAMKMMELDANLARMHAKLSPKMNEEDFWFNYYCRIIFLRQCSGMEGIEGQRACEKWNKEDIIKSDGVSTPPPPSAAPTPVSTASSKATKGESIASTSLSPVFDRKPAGASPPTPPTPALSASAMKASITSSTAAEVAAAMGDDDDLDLEGLDDLNLDDLGDLQDMDMLDDDILAEVVGEDFEKIGSSECNEHEDDELEAQIAKELKDL